MIQLRDYQTNAVWSVWNYFQQGQTGNPIVAMPTGTGKSLVIAELARGILATYPSQRILCLTHVKELIEQNYKKMLEIWPTAPVGIFSAGLKRREYAASIVFAGIGSVKDRALLFQNTNLVFIDECHLVSDKQNTMYRSFLAELKKYNPYLKVIGFTATPYRMGLGYLTEGGLFDHICFDNTGPASFQELIANGHLCKLVPKKVQAEVDVQNVRVQGGEFVQKDILAAIHAQNVNQDALNEMYHLAANRSRWLIFGISIDHTVEVRDRLLHMGVSAVNVHSKMSNDERDHNIDLFRTGQVRAIVNQDILTTGFDVPAVDCIGMLRPTRSTSLWVQMLGRGTRPYPGKENCLVLDFAGNTERLGPIDDPVLPRRRGKGGGGGGGAPVRVCANCMTINHIRHTHCQSCGEAFPLDDKIDGVADTRALMSGDIVQPEIHVFPVTSMILERHQKRDDPPGFRVVYYCGKNGVRRFLHYVLPEHPKPFVRKKAKDWFLAHLPGGSLPPNSVEEALEVVKYMYTPTHIRVHVNRKYPEILDYDFTNTEFNARPDDYHDPRRGVRAEPADFGEVGDVAEAHNPTEQLSSVLPPEWQDFK